MQQTTLSGIELHQLFTSGYRNLKKNMNAVNDLNVFPVPDGDTGTNMVQTFGGGLRSVNAETESVDAYMQALSRAVLLSARGNSGVIFSQFVHGLARGFEGKDCVVFADFAKAFACAKEDAYNAIITPTEGTILTLIREGAEFLNANAGQYSDLRSGFDALKVQMEHTLAKTPDMLAVLKEAGVVDSGGAGLVCFIEGICAHLRGESVEDTPDIVDIISHGSAVGSFGPDSKLEYGYCTEFILQLMNYKTDLAAFDLAAFTKPLEAMGDSIVAVHNDGIVKIHIHTFTPEKALEYGRSFGEFITLKIENMSIQHSQTQTEPKREKVKYAIIAVASGEGIADYFRNIGANTVIDGGQTCNPSVDAFLDAFRQYDAEHIIVLPNNSNIIFTANQAAELYTEADVRVIPTKSIVEGNCALSMMNLWCDTVDELLADMTSGLESVTTAYVTAAIRNSHMDGIAVKKDEYMGLKGKTLLLTGEDKTAVAKELITKLADEEEPAVIIVFHGTNASAEEVAALQSFLEENYPLTDVGFVDGKQDIYDFIISLE